MEIETIYNIGQKFWRMRNNLPAEFTIKGIYITVTSPDPDTEVTQILYNMFCGAHHEGNCPEERFDDVYFPTKRDLINSL